MIEQQKTHKEVQFEITPKTQQCLSQWVYLKNLSSFDFLFPSPRKLGQHICYHYYANIVKKWVSTLGLDFTQYGTHSLRRTKASLIYAKTKNLRAIQLLLGHSKLQSTIEYLGVEIEDALSISESTKTWIIEFAQQKFVALTPVSESETRNNPELKPTLQLF